MVLRCSKCGKIVETIPTNCGYSIAYDEQTHQWGCSMGECGFIPFDEFVCETCCNENK